MPKSKLHNVTKYVFITLGIVFGINSVIAAVLSNIHIGIVLTFIIGIFFLLCGVFLKNIIKCIPKVIKLLFVFVLVISVLCASFLFAYGSFDSITYAEDAVIVLGAGIRGSVPGENLANRLDIALEYYKKNPNAIFVVSGGQGRQEDISEALAMEKYLTERGIPKGKVIKEEKATSTRENFRYSKELLDNYFSTEYSTAFISSDYHILRAEMEAKKAGFENPLHCHNSTPFYLVLPNGIREILAILKSLLVN